MQKIARVACLSALCCFVLQTTGCGYVLYPERRGQTGGELDPAVIIMDGLSLLLFVVPGVIAFAVDITNGTIYLPKGKKSILSSGGKKSAMHHDADVHVIHLNQDAVNDIATLEKIVSNHIGHAVTLNAERHARPLHGEQDIAMLIASLQRQMDQRGGLAFVR